MEARNSFRLLINAETWESTNYDTLMAFFVVVSFLHNTYTYAHAHRPIALRLAKNRSVSRIYISLRIIFFSLSLSLLLDS